MRKAPLPPAAEQPALKEEGLQESLFKGDQAVLSNQDIERILTSKILLADRHRLAILGLDSRRSWYQVIADLEAENSARFLKALASTPRLTQVRLMPTLLVPERRTVPYLREAAARFQADLLLVYSTRTRTFERDRVIGADEVKAESVVESVLLDVRTGIVVHTARYAEDILARKTKTDLDFSQTVAKAEAEATGKALLKVADAVVAFIGDSGK